MRPDKHRLIITAGLLLALFGLPATAPADQVATGPTSDSVRSQLVDPALIEALATRERVGARIFFLDLEQATQPTERSLVNKQVSPTLVDLASALLPGELSLAEVESVQALRGVVDAEAVRGLLERPSVLGIELDETVKVDLSEPEVGLRATCSPSSTRACVQGSRFGIQVHMAGAFAKVAASSAQSAVFWRYGSSNWEVVAKVLNGCSINGYWWVFGAGATTVGYSLNIFDYSSGGSIGYNGAVLCPIADTGMYNTFPCP